MKTPLLLLALICCLFSNGQQYYVSSTYGNDGNSGQDQNHPWRTFAPVNALNTPGIVVSLRKGDIFYIGEGFNQTLAPAISKVQYNSYFDKEHPSEQRPVISGFQEFNAASYVQYVEAAGGGFICKYSLHSEPNVVVVGDKLVELGRHPNSDAEGGGYATPYTYSSPTAIIDAQSIFGNDEQELVIRTKEWSIERKTIDYNFRNTPDGPIIPNEQGGVIHFTHVEDINPTFLPERWTNSTGYGYFFQKGMKLLDKEGEWFYDTQEGLLCIYFSELPSKGITIKASRKEADFLMQVGEQRNITVEDINFEGANKIAIDMKSNFDFRISDCKFQFIAARAIRAIGSSNFFVERCNFLDCLSNGIQFAANSRSNSGEVCFITNCTFKDIGPFIGMTSYTDVGDGCAVNANVGKDFVMEHSLLIDKNTFENVAKAAIRWQGDNVAISNNSIRNAVMHFADFGGLYTYVGSSSPQVIYENRIISGNMVTDCRGSRYGTPGQNSSDPIIRANGIYLDGVTMNVEVRGNTVYRCAKNGIISNTPTNITIADNTLVDNDIAIGFTHTWADLKEPLHGNSIVGNLCYSTTGAGKNISFIGNQKNIESSYSPEVDLHPYNLNADKNIYGYTNPTPFTISLITFNGNYNYPSSPIGIDTWNSQFYQDRHSSRTPARARYMPDGGTYDPPTNFLSDNLIIGGDFDAPQPTFPNPVNFTMNMDNGVSGSTYTLFYTGPSPSPIHGVGSAYVRFEHHPYTPNQYANIFTRPILNINAQSQYLLRVTTRGRLDAGVIDTYLYDNNTGQKITANYRNNFSMEVQEHEFCLIPNSSTGHARLYIKIEGNSGEVMVDDIQLFEVEAQTHPNSDLVSFFYNPNVLNNIEEIITGDYYKDVWENYYHNGPLSLQPLESKLLFLTALINNRPMRQLTPTTPSVAKHSIKCFPNPASSTLTISKLNVLDKWEYIDITNAAGGRIEQFKKIGGLETINLNVSQLAKGVYFATLRKKSGTPVSLKFIKN